MRKFSLISIIAGLAMALASCIEDSYTTDPSAQPVFSVDTLHMGPFFTEDVTPTFSFVVYNRHSKLISISSIRLRDDADGLFRLNVDGFSGREFTNVDIRPNDSIFVFVEATIPTIGTPETTDFTGYLDFVTNGVTSTVVLAATGMDVERRRGIVIDTDTRWSAAYPYQIFDSLVVAPGTTLTLEKGTTLHFHDKAVLKVRGTLVCEGTPEANVTLCGDRTDNVVGSIPFDLMASQWQGVYFYPTSRANSLSHTVVKNTTMGVVVDSIAPAADGTPALRMLNCRLRNSSSYALRSWHSDIVAVGCEFAEAPGGILYLHGGSAVLNHCTLANYYLFTAIEGEALQLNHFNAETNDGSGLPLLRADISNSIIYGIGTDLSHGDLTGSAVMLQRCLLKSAGTDDDNFISCIWDTDPLYRTVREDYYFDYRLQPESPGIGAGWAALMLPEAATDYYGVPRSAESPTVGAYEYTEPEAQ